MRNFHVLMLDENGGVLLKYVAHMGKVVSECSAMGILDVLQAYLRTRPAIFTLQASEVLVVQH